MSRSKHRVCHQADFPGLPGKFFAGRGDKGKLQFSEAKPRSEIRSSETGEIDLQSVKSAVRV